MPAEVQHFVRQGMHLVQVVKSSSQCGSIMRVNRMYGTWASNQCNPYKGP